MTYECFKEKKFTDAHLMIISQADNMLKAFAAKGYTLSLRQLYYQFVARNLIPNQENSYKRLGSIINDARLAGLISWDHIEDRGRQVVDWLVEESPNKVLTGLERNFALDHWYDQDCYVEVWVEKDALSGVVRNPCRKWRVPYMACKGFMSASAMYDAAQRFRDARDNGKTCVLIHLGDHDPSGMDMTRDNEERLEMLSYDWVDVDRIALNMDQIRQYNPPPNPTKVTDSRAGEYMAMHGSTSWELDALQPEVIEQLVTDAIVKYCDVEQWEEVHEREDHEREPLRKIGRNTQAVLDFIENLKED